MIGMTRLQYFTTKCRDHVLYRRLALRLSESEFDLAVDFIQENDHLDFMDFEAALNRMFIGKPKTKHWSIVQELVHVANGCKSTLYK